MINQTLTATNDLAFRCVQCGRKTNTVLKDGDLCMDCAADRYISKEPLTPEEEMHLRRLAWELGTDEDRALLRRAGYDFSGYVRLDL